MARVSRLDAARSEFARLPDINDGASALSHATTDGLVGHYLAEEIDAAFLYRELAAVETDGKRRDLFQKLAEVEDRHVERWESVLVEQGGVVSTDRKPTGRARLVAWVARRLGPGAVLPMILREEGREVAAYLRLARQSTDASTSETAAALAADSAMHAQELAHIIGRPGEPWHSSEAGGYLRSVIYGFNDGLTANFGLVAGVIGATSANASIVIISGIAGALSPTPSRWGPAATSPPRARPRSTPTTSRWSGTRSA